MGDFPDPNRFRELLQGFDLLNFPKVRYGVHAALRPARARLVAWEGRACVWGVGWGGGGGDLGLRPAVRQLKLL